MAGLKKNKDLDLRRYGKNLYTKAMQNSGSGGSDGDDILNGYRAFKQSMESKGFDIADAGISVEVYRAAIEEYGDVPQYTYGNLENAKEVMVFMNRNTAQISAAFLTKEEWEAFSDSMFWKFDVVATDNNVIGPLISGLVDATLAYLLLSTKLPEVFGDEYTEETLEEALSGGWEPLCIGHNLTPAGLSAIFEAQKGYGYSISILRKDDVGGGTALKIYNGNDAYYTPINFILA